MCCTVGDDGMDRGQAGEKRKRLPPFVLYLSLRTWLVWESGASCCRSVSRGTASAELGGERGTAARRPIRIAPHPGSRFSRSPDADGVINCSERRPSPVLPLSPDRARLIPTPVDRRIQTCQQRRTARRIGVKPSARHNCSSTGRRYSTTPLRKQLRRSPRAARVEVLLSKFCRFHGCVFIVIAPRREEVDKPARSNGVGYLLAPSR